MKKILIPLIALCISCGAGASNPLSNVLGGLGGNNGQSSATDAISGLISGLLGGEASVESMAGTWTYTGPAVCFQSENFLQQAGGAAAAGTIEGKLKPYFSKLGLSKLTLTIDEQGNFTMQNGKMQLSGTVTKEKDDTYFNFTAMGKINLGKIRTYVTVAGSSMSVMFDVTKLVNVIKAMASVTNNASVSTVSSLLSSYDGICVGFKMKK